MCHFQSHCLLIINIVCQSSWVVTLVYSFSSSKFPLFNEMQMYITVFMKPSRWTLFSACWFPSTLYIILVYVKVSIWIFHLRINVDSGCWTEMQEYALLYLLYARHIWSLSHWSSEWELLFLSHQSVFPPCNNERRAKSLTEMLCSFMNRKLRTKLSWFCFVLLRPWKLRLRRLTCHFCILYFLTYPPNISLDILKLF
jgi:hypothetical protein